MKENNRKINRRNFLKALGAGSVVTTAALTGCRPKNSVSAEGSSIGEVPTDKMTYRVTPTTGDKVSLLGFGCMRWPLMKNPNGEGEIIDQDAVNELVDYAIEHGVNYFDTAPRYVRGMSEIATGIALKRHPRDKFFIATKLSNMAVDKELRSFGGSTAMYRASFERLQVDYIDYYLIHTAGLESDGGMKGIKERIFDNGMLDFLIKERKAGRIRNLGFSYHGDIRVYDYLLSLDYVKWDFVQIQLNYVDYRHASGRNFNAEYLIGELAKRNIPAVIMEPLLGGRLASLPVRLVPLLKEKRPESSIASWAFRFAGSFPNVLSVLSGMLYVEHLQDNIRTFSPLEPLTEPEYALLEEIGQNIARSLSVPCTTCQYCMPCPYGIDIPSVFSHYNRCVNDGTIEKSSRAETYNQARREFLVGYDRSVPRLRQASHCTGCNICYSHCPQRIQIPQEMRRIDKYVEELRQGQEF